MKSSYLVQTNYHLFPRGIPAHECQNKASYFPVRKYSLCFVKMMTQRCLHLKNKTKQKYKQNQSYFLRLFYQHVCFPGVSLLPGMFFTYDKILCVEITTQPAWKWKDIWPISSMCKRWKTGHYTTAALTRCSPRIYCSGKNPTKWQGSASGSFTGITSAGGTCEHFKTVRAKSTGSAPSLFKKWTFITCHLEKKVITHNLPFTFLQKMLSTLNANLRQCVVSTGICSA